MPTVSAKNCDCLHQNLWRVALAYRVELAREPSDQEIDLFEMILEGAVRDEDNRKVPYYVASVDLYLKEQWSPALVRVVTGALKELAKEELDAFGAFVNREGDLSIPEIKGLWGTDPREMFRLRLGALSLMPATGVITPDTITPVGKKVARVVGHAGAQ